MTSMLQCVCVQPQKQRQQQPLLLLVAVAVLALQLCDAAPAHPWNPIKLAGAGGSGRPAYLYVPPTYTKAKPSPLVIMFHAAGKGAGEALDLLDSQQGLLDKTRTLVLLPQSQGPTWSLQMNGGKFGAGEMGMLRSAMTEVMGTYNIDRSKVALAGFSDGATVAVSLLPLGGIASKIIAWSPGGFAPPMVNGRPGVAVFHGTKDELFPIDKTSRVIVPQMRKALPNSQVSLVEGAYAHDAPPAAVKQGLEWFLLGKPLPAAAAGRVAQERGSRMLG